MAAASRQLTFAEKSELQRHFAAQRGGARQGDMVEWVRATFGKSVGRSSIGRILGAQVDATLRPQRLRRRFSQSPRAEAALLEFVRECVARNELERIGDDTLWETARAAAAAAGERHVSMSWVQRFKARNGVRADRRSLLLLTGDSGEAARAELLAALTRSRDELLASISAKEAAKAAAQLQDRLVTVADASPTECSADDTPVEVEGESGEAAECEPEEEEEEEREGHSYEPHTRLPGMFTSPPGRSSIGSRRVSLSSSHGGDELEWETERRRRVELEEREVELRVESLHCDNVLKRIRIVEESMLARKRLRDAGISEAEINALIPVVAVPHPELDANSGLRQLGTPGQTPEKQT